MGDETLEPCELVVEPRPGLRIAVRQVDRRDDDAVDVGFEIARLAVGIVTGKAPADLARRLAFRKDRDTVVRTLSMPDRAVPGFGDGLRRKLRVVGLDLLQADDIGRRFVEPLDEPGEAG